MNLHDTGKVKIGIRYFPRLSAKEATAFSGPTYQNHTMRNLILFILFVALLVMGAVGMIFITNTDDLYHDTSVLGDIHGDPCAVFGATTEVVKHGDIKCRIGNVAVFYVINHEGNRK